MPRTLRHPCKVRIPHLHAMKAEGRKWAMLTAYDMYADQIFDQAGIDFLLVGDSAGNTVFGSGHHAAGHHTTSSRSPVRSSRAHASSGRRRGGHAVRFLERANQALHTAIRFMKETGAHAVKLEGGVRSAKQIRRVIGRRGSPSWRTSASLRRANTASAATRPGRGDGRRQLLVDDAPAVEDAGAFAVVLEMVPAGSPLEGHKGAVDPHHRVGAGNHTGTASCWCGPTGAGCTKGPHPESSSRQYANLRGTLLDAARAYAADVESGAFPDTEHSFES